jgi:hypothetical protein
MSRLFLQEVQVHYYSYSYYSSAQFTSGCQSEAASRTEFLVRAVSSYLLWNATACLKALQRGRNEMPLK